MDYKFVDDLLTTAEVPKEGIHSRVLQKDEHMNITLFGFSAGQKLSTHSAPTPAVICILNGEADITLGEDVHHAKRLLRVRASTASPCNCREDTYDDAPRSNQGDLRSR